MPFPLRSPRMLIEPLSAADVEDFVGYRRDPEVARYQSWDVDYSEADARKLVAGQPDATLPGPGRWLQLAVRSTNAPILYGDVAVHRLADQPHTFEVGVTFARRHQGRGYATEALERLLAHLFDQDAHRIVASCDARNTAVASLLRRVGLRLESHQVEADFFKGGWTDLDGYAILAREYQQAHRRPGPLLA